MKKSIVFLMSILLMTNLVKAQVAVKRLTLEEAIEYAVEHNKQLQNSQLDIELYKYKVRESISQGLPQIDGSINYSTNFGYKMNFGGSAIKMKDQSNLNLTVNQLIFSGQWILGVQTSKIAEELTRQEVEITELDIIENICNTYYAILVSERLLAIVGENIELMEETYRHTQNMFQQGTVEQTDVDQLRVTVNQLKNSYSSLERTVQVNYNLLRLQLGLDDDTEVILTDGINRLLNEDSARRLYLERFNIADNPEYQLLNTQVELNKKMLGLEKWSFAPTVVGSYGFSHKLIKPELDMSPKHSAGFTMSIPIFSGLQRSSAVAQARINLEKTYLSQSLLQDQLNLQNDQLKFELKNAMENYDLQKDNIDVANRVLESYKRKYEYGVISSLDLTNANANYLEAESNYTNAVLTLMQAQISLQRLYNQLPN